MTAVNCTLTHLICTRFNQFQSHRILGMKRFLFFFNMLSYRLYMRFVQMYCNGMTSSQVLYVFRNLFHSNISPTLEGGGINLPGHSVFNI